MMQPSIEPNISDSLWLVHHPSPSWLSEFEAAAVSVVSPNNDERIGGERVLKRWVDAHNYPCDNLLLVIQTSTDIRVVIVAVLLCRNVVFKRWARSLEEEQLADKLSGATNNIVGNRLEQKSREPSYEAVLENTLQLTQGLVDVGLNRWSGDLSSEINAARNQIFGLVSLLIKKGWSQSTNSAESRFYPLVQRLLDSATHIFETAWNSSDITHSNLMCLKLIIELSRTISSIDISSVGISWDDYMDAKKLYERRILSQLMPSVLQLFQQIIVQGTCSSTNQMTLTQMFSSYPFFSNIVESAMNIFEIFVDWEFSYSRCQALLSTELWFIPGDNWYPVLFEIPSPISANTLTNFFHILINLYSLAHSDLLSSIDTFNAALSVFRKIMYIVNRSAQFRSTRMNDRFGYRHDMTREQRQIHLTRLLYCPIVEGLIQRIESSLFMARHTMLFNNNDGSNMSNNNVSCWGNVRAVAEEEIQCLSHSLARIIENPDIHLLTLLSINESNHKIEILEWCFTRLLPITTDTSDEPLISSIENFTIIFSRLAILVTGIQTNLLNQFVWIPSLNLAASRITSQFLSSALSVVSLRDGDIETDIEVCNTGYTVSSIISPFVNDSLREFASIGQCKSRETAQYLITILEKKNNLLHQIFNDTTQSRDAIHLLYDEIVWLFGYITYFITEAADRIIDSKQRRVIPRAFLLQSECQPEVTQLFLTVTNTMLSSLCGGQYLPPSVIEGGLSILTQFVEAYILQEHWCGSHVFPFFTTQSSGSSAMNSIVTIIDNSITAFSQEPNVCYIALTCLLKAASPLSPTVIILWDCPALRSLCEGLPDLANFNINNKLSTLRTKYLCQLAGALASATSTSDHIKVLATEQSEALCRSGTLLTLEVAQNRYNQLVSFCAPIRDTLISIGNELAAKQQQCNPENIRLESQKLAFPEKTHRIAGLLAICTGLVRGISDHRGVLYKWLRPITAIAVPSIARTYMLYPDVLRAIVKFLYHVGLTLLSDLPPDMMREFFLSVQVVTESFAECHGTVTLDIDHDDDDDNDDEPDDTVVQNIGLVFKLLTFVLSQSSCTHAAIPSDDTWSPRLVISSITVLHPVLQRKKAFLNNGIRLAYANLLFQLFEQHGNVVLNHLTLSLARSYCYVINEALFSSNARCQTAGSEALGACTKCLINHQRKLNMISYSLTSPENCIDLFELSAETQDVLSVFEHEIAQIGLRLMISAASVTSVASKESIFYSDAACDVFSFLSIKIYHLKRLFEHFAQLHSYENAAIQKEMARSAFIKAADPILTHFYEASHQAQQAIENGQSASMQQIKYNQFRTGFRQLFETLVLACRIGTAQKK